MQEIWNHPVESLNIDGYNLIAKPRTGGIKGGGVALFLKDCYNYSVIDSPFSQLIFESVSIIVEVPGCDKFVVTSLYRPPTCPDAEFFDILDLHLSDLENLNYLFLYVLTPTITCSK